MKIFNRSSVIALLVLVLFSSCSYRLVDFTVISSKNHELRIDKSIGVRVSGSSNGFLGLGASIKDAMDKALQSAGPEYDLLIDGVVRVNDFILITGYKVEGTAISSKKLKAMLGEEGFELWCKENKLFNLDNAQCSN